MQDFQRVCFSIRELDVPAGLEEGVEEEGAVEVQVGQL